MVGRGTISRVLSRVFISLGCQLPGVSCSPPEGLRNGPLRHGKTVVPSAWPCSRWGLPSQPVTRSAGALLPHRFTLATTRTTARKRPHDVRRFAFCCTFPILADGGRYPPSCPVEPGLSSECHHSANTCSSADFVDHNSAESWRQPEMVNRGGILGNAEPKSHQPRPSATLEMDWTSVLAVERPGGCTGDQTHLRDNRR